MNSVLRPRQLVQPFLWLTVGVTAVVLWGCTPPPANQKKAPPATTVPKPIKVEEPAELPPIPEAPAKEEAAPKAEPKEEPAVEPAVKEEPPKEEPAKPEAPKEEPAKPEPPKEEPAKPEPPKEEPAKPEPPKEEPAKETAAPAPQPEPAPPATPPAATPEPAPAPPPPSGSPAPAATTPTPSPPTADAKTDKFEPMEVPTVTWLPAPVGVPESAAKDEKEMKPYSEEISGTGVKFDMVPIPGGKFMMGSPDSEAERKDDEGPQHEVVIEPFWMGKCEVTWDEYEQWALGLDLQRRTLTKQEATPVDLLADAVARPTKPYTDMTFGMGKEKYPAICMTQLSARMYCKWLSAKTGRYYRLPTEAEWEYACRAGTTTAYSFGDDPKQIDEYAWYLDNCDDKYHKVGQKKPNPWGLHDMHGNVSEWVLDQYVANGYQQYAGKTTTRPFVVPTTIIPRGARGGCWDDEAPLCRSATRKGSSKDWKMQDPQIPQSIWYVTEINCPGFRVIRPLRVPDLEESKLYEPDVQEVKDYRAAQAGKQ